MLRLIIMLPFLIALVVFVVYNGSSTAMSVPGYSWQTSPGVVALISAVVFFLLGALFVWFAELRQRRRARRAEQTIRGLEAQIAELRGQISGLAAQHGAVPAGAVAPSGTVIAPPAAY